MSVDLKSMTLLWTPINGEIEYTSRDAHAVLDMDGERCSCCGRFIGVQLYADEETGYDRATYVDCWFTIHGLQCEDCISDQHQATGDWYPAVLPGLFLYSEGYEDEVP
jgi:hypothetical protein